MAVGWPMQSWTGGLWGGACKTSEKVALNEGRGSAKVLHVMMSTKQLLMLLGTTCGASALIDMWLSSLAWPGFPHQLISLHFTLCVFSPCPGSREVWQRVQCPCSAQCCSFPKKSHNGSGLCVGLSGHECMKLKHLRLYEGRRRGSWTFSATYSAACNVEWSLWSSQQH